MNSFSGYTNLPATVIAAPVPGTCLPGNQDRLRRWNVARSTLQRGRKSDWAISGLGYFLLAVFEKLIAGVIHFLSRLCYGIMITGHGLWSGFNMSITTAGKQAGTAKGIICKSWKSGFLLPRILHKGFDTRKLPDRKYIFNRNPCAPCGSWRSLRYQKGSQGLRSGRKGIQAERTSHILREMTTGPQLLKKSTKIAERVSRSLMIIRRKGKRTGLYQTKPEIILTPMQSPGNRDLEKGPGSGLQLSSKFLSPGPGKQFG